MPEEPDRTALTLENEKSPAQKRNSRPTRFRVFLGFLGAFVITLGVAILGRPEPFVVVMVLMFVTYFVWQIAEQIKYKRKSRAADEEFDAEWEQDASLKKEMLQIARDVYRLAPIGQWQVKVVTYPERGWPNVHFESVLELKESGTGTYRWIHHDLGSQGETEFEYKPLGDGVIAVRLKFLPAKEWVNVTFEFDVRKNRFNKMELNLCLDGENPLEGELKMHWPFDQTLVRQE